MSKIIDAFKAIPEAIKNWEGDLPRSDATGNFPGKGFLTALVDVSGSEINRRREFQEQVRQSKVKPLLDNYWKAVMEGTPEEMEAWQSEILGAFKDDKYLSKWLQEELLPKGQQIASARRIVGEVPKAMQGQTSAQAPQPPTMAQPQTPGTPSLPEPAGVAAAAQPVGETTAARPLPPGVSSMLPPPPIDDAPLVPTSEQFAPPAPVTGLYDQLKSQVGAPAPPAATSPMQSLLRKVSPKPLDEYEKAGLEVAKAGVEDTAKTKNKVAADKEIARHAKELEAQFPGVDIAAERDLLGPDGRTRMVRFYNRKDNVTYGMMPEAPQEFNPNTGAAATRPALGESKGMLDGQQFNALRIIDPATQTMTYYDPSTREDITGRFTPTDAPTERMIGAATTPLTGVDRALNDAFQSATATGFTLAAQNIIQRQAARLAQQGLEKKPELQRFIIQKAIESETAQPQAQILGRVNVQSELDSIDRLINELSAAGVPTGILSGTWEGLVRHLGLTTDPRMVELKTRASQALQRYTNAVSGAQFGEQEARRYMEMFPNGMNSVIVNKAQIKALRDSMQDEDRNYWRFKVGPEGMTALGIPNGYVAQQDRQGGGKVRMLHPDDGRVVLVPEGYVQEALKPENGYRMAP